MANKSKPIKILFKVLLWIIIVVFVIISVYYTLQKFVAHIEKPFCPSYERVELTENSDYETIFLQTGLGKPVVDKLKNAGRFNEILSAQDRFFKQPEVECVEVLGLFTLKDMLVNDSTYFYDLQAGDILISLSTHSFGWRHGHAAIVINPYQTVESVCLGTNSSVEGVYGWYNYSNVAVLRVKDKTKQERQAVADFTLEHLTDVPYGFLAGHGKNKARDVNDENLTMYCSFLAWYAWNYFGVDVDSDGGRVVTSYDILHSNNLEVVQLYGFNPYEFI